MSDKELDLLFKSKFTDYEVEPSVSSWSKIEEQLSVKPMQRKKVPFLWMAAASVVVVFGLGLLLWNKPQEQIMLKGKPAVEEGDRVIAQNNAVNTIDEVITNTQPAEAKVETVSRVAQEETPNTTEESNSQENYLASIQTENPEAEQEFAATRTEPVKRITVTELMLLEEENTVKTNKIKSTMLSSLSSSKDESSNQQERIRSVGDLVNFVIAKVDKRENKVLKISKTDESDIEITGINLGLFKYKKD
ncbi:hypothetical protein FYC62_10035 [Pedobacter aquae]|uniref:Uncharacterized protein n=2 Tax=Pedobacter aquae TaxID=2605747 RepID=A0A5C0VLA5_9SPHI|nr:hypothetical protein FYC62_10035 [Pedobacter aquae]